ncbi:MAG: IS21 family transposase, partial [Actinomycetota bacterium]|nr:IS21 family transposase [Actinomycetota bacterium]
ALVELGGVAVTVHLFVMRASFSGAAFCQASLVETQQAFLELHVQAFEWFGGVFADARFDNLTSAVKQVLKGRRRVETDRFVALASHYMLASQFTLAGRRR